MKPFYDHKNITIYHGDCLEVMKTLQSTSVDAVVTDPPYGIKFMNKGWDYSIPDVPKWEEVLRIIKPGGHLLSFAGTRTQHRMAVNIEDAGFEIRDMLLWMFGGGMPKSLNISKFIDKQKGLKQKVIGPNKYHKRRINSSGVEVGDNVYGKMGIPGGETTPNSPEAKQWEGWGTNLKPSIEPITLARKPLSEKTIAANVIRWGTGGINIDGSRIEGEPIPEFVNGVDRKRDRSSYDTKGSNRTGETSSKGRFPANLIHDGSEAIETVFPETSSGGSKGYRNKRDKGLFTSFSGYEALDNIPKNKGSASRYFYCAKASKKERGAGNNHPTVKPLKLIKHLCGLVTPINGIVLDPFGGSFTTALACIDLGFRFIGIEQSLHYCEIGIERITEAFTNKDKQEANVSKLYQIGFDLHN